MVNFKCSGLLAKFFPKRYFLWVCMSSFGGCMWDVNDVTVWPGSSTSPPSDPRRETVWYGLAANGLAANGLAANGLAANSLLRVFRRSDFIYTKNSAAKKSWRHGVRTHDVRIKTRFLDHLVKWVPVWKWYHFCGKYHDELHSNWKFNGGAKNLMGAMHQKIAIFKEENSVCRVQNFRISQNGTTF